LIHVAIGYRHYLGQYGARNSWLDSWPQ